MWYTLNMLVAHNRIILNFISLKITLKWNMTGSTSFFGNNDFYICNIKLYLKKIRFQSTF